MADGVADLLVSNRTDPPPGIIIARPRLERQLTAGLGYRLTTLISGAGAGKTVLLRSWAQEHRVAWHTVTSADEVLVDFVRSVVDALRLRFPRLSSELSLAVEGVRGPDRLGDDETRAEGLAGLLAQELASLEGSRPIVLILDDVHQLTKAGARFVASLAINSPGRVHLYCASRESMPFAVTRLALDGHHLDIPAAELSFTAAEAEQLLAMLIEAPDPQVAQELIERTAGWPAAARLAVEAMRAKGTMDLDTILSDTRGTALFDFLGETVTETETNDVRHVLEVAAILPWIAPDLADHLGAGKGSASLATAVQRRIYFVEHDRWPGAHRLAPVMRAFVSGPDSAAEIDASQVLEEAGRWYERVTAFPEAIESFQRAGALDACTDLLLEHGTAVLSGLPDRVVSLCVDLPSAARTQAIVQLEGEARQMIGDWEGALRCYQSIASDSESLDAALAWRYGLLHHLRGELDEALDVYRRGAVDKTDPANAALLYGWTASARWLKGEHESTRLLAQESMVAALESGEPRALACAHTVAAMVAALDGDRNANDAHYLRALEHAERAQDLLQTVRIRANRGSLSLEEGAYNQALEELDIALRLADLAGFASLRALALSNRGQVHSHQGRLEEAIADLEDARRGFRANSSTLESYALGHIGDVYLVRGDRALAQAAYEQAIALSERTGDLQGLVPALAGLSRLLVSDDLPQAAELADRAIANSAVLGHVEALLASAEVALAAGDHERAGEVAGKAAELARTRRDRPGLATAFELLGRAQPERAGDHFRQARSIWENVGDPVRVAGLDLAMAHADVVENQAELAQSAIQRLQRLGAHGLIGADALSLTTPPKGPDITIRTLGGFAVVRHGVVVPANEWQSKKARELLKILVSMRGRTQHREVIMDLLWPGDDPSKAANRLSVALSTVRSILDPGKANEPDRYIVGDRDSVGLNMSELAVDAEQFMTQAERGLALWRQGDRAPGRSILEAAEATYLGDFLEEDLYADWSVTIREECRSTYLQIAEVLADAFTAEGDHDGASRLYLRILERDEFHEPAHLGLVTAMTRLGRHGAARRIYSQYMSRMRELDVEPAAFPR